MKTIIIKLGGSVITDKNSFPPKALTTNIERLAQEIAQGIQEKPAQLVIIHGAGSFGHILARDYQLTKNMWDDKKRVGTIKIRKKMEQLNQKVVSALVKAGLSSIAFQPSSGSILENKTLVQFSGDVVREFLNHGIIPVTYGDISVDLVTGMDILSGDQIIAYLTNFLNPDLVIIGTDVDGVFTHEPKQHSEAILIPQINATNQSEVIRGLSGSKSIDVTGGMAGKITKLLELAHHSSKILLINALEKGRLYNAITGRPCPSTQICHEALS